MRAAVATYSAGNDEERRRSYDRNDRNEHERLDEKEAGVRERRRGSSRASTIHNYSINSASLGRRGTRLTSAGARQGTSKRRNKMKPSEETTSSAFMHQNTNQPTNDTTCSERCRVLSKVARRLWLS